MSDYEDYYARQAQTGIAVYSHSDMKGAGFFGRFIGSTVVPLVSRLAPLAIKGARHLLDTIDPPPPSPREDRKRKRRHRFKHSRLKKKKLF